ncbi:MAG: glutathione S-transferase family protein [Thiotrichaceae bacterium]|nr:glutathione S-transferase family protein [Thiotrichaceae bacterium]MBL1262027.1 glutathione S-transferase family protein [Thiotrichaceae bacterium]PCI13237.1 MAG: glutathione-dependent reductase [Thiotrichales bacterium]
MGLLVKGVWRDEWYDTTESGGTFVRNDAQFRNWVTADGSAGPGGKAGFVAEPGRYHLYVSLACPWAHRTLIFRQLKQLQDAISVSVVDPHMLQQGWLFSGHFESTLDEVNKHNTLYQLYLQAQPDYSGRVTVPVLWDKQLQTIVSNESSEIIRMFNSAFDAHTRIKDDYYPQPLREEIDEINAMVYDNINNGVYRCGFATTQAAYEKAFEKLFNALDEVELCLSQQRYLVGEQITEADWRLFTTLVRFDAVYVGHFKCNKQRIADYPNLSHYLRALYQQTGIAGTVNMIHIKQHYYYSHDTINPTRVVPMGPQQDFNAAHDRD